MNDVLRAGEALKGDLTWSDQTSADIEKIFQVANSWRDSHAYPMRSIRQSVVARTTSLGLQGLTVARLKRMRSIRRKLRTIPAKLNQIQDLGGCRVILPSIADVNLLVENLVQGVPHDLRRQFDYINHPKDDGYRCYHLVYNFRGKGESETYNGRRIEVQIRTRLQHAWATAVEAIGLLRKEDMKGGQGDPRWLRLFQLMSAEIALAEGCSERSVLPPRNQRIEEIQYLNKNLQAVETLENARWAVNYTMPPAYPMNRPAFYRIEYNNETNEVNVTEHFGPMSGIKAYGQAEMEDNLSGKNKINTVFIEADKVEDLKQAYPNYFGDVNVFNTNLKRVTEGLETKEFTMPPQYRPPPPPHEPPDLAWFRQHKHRQWSYPRPRNGRK